MNTVNSMNNAKLFYFSCLQSDLEKLEKAIDIGIEYFEDIFAGKECNKYCFRQHKNCEKGEMQKYFNVVKIT